MTDIGLRSAGGAPGTGQSPGMQPLHHRHISIPMMAVIGGVALVVVYFLWKGRQGTATAAQTTNPAGTYTPVSSSTDGSSDPLVEGYLSGLQGQLSNAFGQYNGELSQVLTNTTPATTTGSSFVTLGGAPGLPNAGIWSTNVATAEGSPGGSLTSGPNIPYGQYQLAGAPFTQGGSTYYPINFNGTTFNALGENVQGMTSTSGPSAAA